MFILRDYIIRHNLLIPTIGWLYIMSKGPLQDFCCYVSTTELLSALCLHVFPRCKSYGTWLAEKEVEAGNVREAGKKKEIEKRSLEERVQIRKLEAERKYKKWMREKYEEELKKEEELQRLLEEKWKLKEKSKVRRKSAPVKTYNAIKQKSSKTQSLPVL